MPRFAIAIALACLAGCASSPNEIRAESNPHTLASKGVPETVAYCIARAAEADSPGVVTQARPMKAGAWEVIINNPGHGPMAVADIVPTQGGSRIEMRFWQPLLSGPQRFLEPWTKGC